MSVEYVLLGASVLLLLSILASKASNRFGVPALLLFLVIGMLAGSEGPGGIYFDDPSLAQSLGVVALAFILFSGGLDTNWQSVRPVLVPGVLLSTLGVLLSASVLGLVAVLVLGVPPLEALLLGAIVSSTDAAAVFSILRARGVSLRGHLAPLIELESGTNDPMAVFLTIGMTQLAMVPETSAVALVPAFLWQMSAGAAIGWLLGRGAVRLINHLELVYEGLYPVLTLSVVLFVYGCASALGGNGFLGVYVAGVVMGNLDFLHKKTLLRFHDGIGWLMQIAMFLTLGLLVFPSRIVPVIGVGLLIATVLIFVARPISVFVTLAFTRMTIQEKALVSWVGLRGAVPIVLATFPLVQGLPRADLFFNVVFFVVLTSVLLQGTSIGIVARWLGLEASGASRSKPPIELSPVTGNFASELFEIEIPADSAAAGKPLVALGFPPSALAILVQRGERFLVPGGSTVLEAADVLLVLADKSALQEVRAIVASDRERPAARAVLDAGDRGD